MSSHRSEYPENKKANWLRMLLISDLHQTNFVFFPAIVESSMLACNASNYFVKLFHVRFVDLLTCEYSCLSSLLVKTSGGGGTRRKIG